MILFTTYWGLVTRRVCLGGGPTGAAVWQFLCRRCVGDCCLLAHGATVDLNRGWFVGGWASCVNFLLLGIVMNTVYIAAVVSGDE